jgi:hypothetical protein
VEAKLGGPNNGWQNLKLIAGLGLDSRRYSLGWNGQRLARSRMVALAADRFPAELESLVEWLEAGQP